MNFNHNLLSFVLLKKVAISNGHFVFNPKATETSLCSVSKVFLKSSSKTSLAIGSGTI